MSTSRLAALAQSLASLRRADFERLGKKWGLRGLAVVNVVCAVHLFAEHVGFIHVVSGPSMLPTMSAAGEVVFENRMVSPKSLKRGDLVTYISPLDPTRVVCKRLIGLPGDIICVDPTGRLAPSTEHVVIPKGHVWFIGDNAEMSRDSRQYGPVSMGLIRGKLMAKVWPPTAAGFFRNNFVDIGVEGSEV
ncbi:signal peptidase I family protein [Phanerochaete sordida]|uniref:Signal peptidase I family protein n=1 Tax=Phanerochaete sordida TaxID=48140 RepID=A0A9P3G042_9APHY|nr:signal peptidase I family protein [Phanerochaete sordida]